ncbi:MAG: hypothetical protein C0467_22455 [Planctomycetaceae bacterium]|nr:hypothetical protein [Planctomycetaceae bacterium]
MFGKAGACMGLVASLEVVPAVVFKRHKDALAELVAPPGAPTFWLDKSWLQFHTTLRARPKPLCLAISGDHSACGRLEGGLVRAQGEEPGGDGDESEDELGDDFYLGYASPALVQKVDQALEKLTEETMLAAIKAAGWSLGTGGKKYYGTAFRELKKAYRAAAKQKDALQVLIT